MAAELWDEGGNAALLVAELHGSREPREKAVVRKSIYSREPNEPRVELHSGPAYRAAMGLTGFGRPNGRLEPVDLGGSPKTSQSDMEPSPQEHEDDPKPGDSDVESSDKADPVGEDDADPPKATPASELD